MEDGFENAMEQDTEIDRLTLVTFIDRGAV